MVNTITAKGRVIYKQKSPWSIGSYYWIDDRKIGVEISNESGGLLLKRSVTTYKIVILTLTDGSVKTNIVKEAKVKSNMEFPSFLQSGILEYDLITSGVKSSVILSDINTGKQLTSLNTLANSLIKKLNNNSQEFIGLDLSPDQNWIVFYIRKKNAFIENLWLCNRKGILNKLTNNNRENSYSTILGWEKTKLFYRYSLSTDLNIYELDTKRLIKKKLPSDFGEGGIAGGKLAYETPNGNIKIKKFIKVVPLEDIGSE